MISSSEEFPIVEIDWNSPELELENKKNETDLELILCSRISVRNVESRVN